MTIPVYFHEDQLLFHPTYEWDKRGYVPHPENRERVDAILTALHEVPDEFEIRQPTVIPLDMIEKVHIPELLKLYHTAENMPDDEPFYPTSFPKYHQARANPANLNHTGYFCFDTSTPIGKQTFNTAVWSAASAYAAAKHVLDGESKMSYALCRPPGHHAFREYFGGYCYLNNAAIAATLLRGDHDSGTKVVILDIDYHHGDGTQSVFYEDRDILTVSLHANPTEQFPYFSGFEDEIGSGPGENVNMNICLSPGCNGKDFMDALKKRALKKIAKFKPDYLIVAAGQDTYKDDPLCDFTLETEDFFTIGEAIGKLGFPTVVVQEGGYYIPALGINVKTLLKGVRQGVYGQAGL